ncbi:catalase [uncultured Clostridium sp.]|uniref:catalase n=1 Tax=uncultured Clostridium sp. TaxID=59620 RepID=UPI0026298763|nr:catalase [uncultured Clostridium sp.]
MKKNIYTTATGNPVTDDNNSIGTNEGYGLIQDVHLVEKLAHFNRERIPERVVHAKGAGAYGEFEVTHDVTKYTRAAFLSKIGKKTKMFARFSTVGGELGSADTARDPRGFALKFYTEEGNYDMVGNNTPIFFIRDSIKFPDFIHTQKRNPKTHLKDHNAFWDFASLNPETIHQFMFIFTNYGTPDGFRHMNGFSSHTYMWYNEKKEYVWVKYHFISDQKRKDLSAEEADRLAGVNPDYATEDLFNAIERGEYPSWTMYIQMMTPEEAEEYKFDPFDITKVWYHKDYPLMPVGRFTLNENPKSFFIDVEQAAFAPSHLVPGIAPSPDKLLQGRLLSYSDAHRYRLGANVNNIPVNQTKNCQINTKQRDGANYTNYEEKDINYYPNGEMDIITDEEFAPPEVPITGTVARHIREIKDVDFIQPRAFYERVLNDEGKETLIKNIVNHMCNIKENVQYRQIALFYKVNSELGSKIAEKLNLEIDKVKRLSMLEQKELVKETKSSI